MSDNEKEQNMMSFEVIHTTNKEDCAPYFRMAGETAARHGSIGCYRIDFDLHGNELQSEWCDYQPHLKTPAFKHEFDEVMNFLRDDGQHPPLISRASLDKYCHANFDTWSGVGFIRTQNYSYYIRFQPHNGTGDVLCFAYDNRYLLPELAGQHELPEYCYSTTLTGSEIIVVRRGEHGCFTSFYNEHDTVLNREYVNKKNAELGVTKAQEKAMYTGSMLDWNTPAAKPWNYDKDGTPRKLAPRKKEHER